MVFAQWRWLRQLLNPYTILSETVLILVIDPLVINWAGAGVVSVTIVTFIISLAPVIANTIQCLVSVDENFTHLFLIYKATPAQILFRLRLSNALPDPLRGIRISIGISVIGGITGELFAGSTRVCGGGVAMR
jgi:NitT/TauT family transport system permease protein